ncbi:MAG: hypothetical protein CXT68_06125 [Methanobacteriota archaeon]|nr:MAG: hypothetical protein CXT68_06125 [Euryarchaeota archaeon]
MLMTGESLAKSPPKKSLLRLWIERPLGIGVLIGIVAGSLNSIMLGVPMLTSILVGSVLGLVVCTLGCPAMRTKMLARRERKRVLSVNDSKRVRATSAFSTFD